MAGRPAGARWAAPLCTLLAFAHLLSTGSAQVVIGAVTCSSTNPRELWVSAVEQEAAAASATIRFRDIGGGPGATSTGAVLADFRATGVRAVLYGCGNPTLASALALDGILVLRLVDIEFPADPLIISYVPSLHNWAHAVQSLVRAYGWARVGMLIQSSTLGAQLGAAVYQALIVNKVDTIGHGSVPANLPSLEFAVDNIFATSEPEGVQLNVAVVALPDGKSTGEALLAAHRQGYLNPDRAMILREEPDLVALEAVYANATERVAFLDTYRGLNTVLLLTPLDNSSHPPADVTRLYALDTLEALLPGLAIPGSGADIVSHLVAAAPKQGLTGPLNLEAGGSRAYMDHFAFTPIGAKAARVSFNTTAITPLGEGVHVIDVTPILVRVGMVISRSGIDRGIVSQERELAARAAVEFLNSRVAGFRIEFILFDRVGCAESARELIAADIAVAIGPGSSECAIEMAPVLAAAGIAMVGYSETAAPLSDKTRFPLFFRIPPSDDFQGRVLADLSVRFGWDNVGTIATNDAYGLGLAGTFESAFRARGGSIASAVRLPTGADVEAVDESVAELVVDGSAVHLISAVTTDALSILRSADEASFAGPGFTWIGTDGSAGSELPERVAEAFVGFVGVQPPAGSGPLWDAFLLFQGFTQFNRFAASAGSLLRYVPHIVDAFRAVQVALTRELKGAGQVTRSSITLTLQTKRAIVLKGLRTINSSATAFEGAIGIPVFFNAEQDGPVLYDVVNLREGGRWVQVGEFADDALALTSAIIWSDGTTALPSDVPPAEPRSRALGSGGIAALAVVLTLLVVGLVCFAFYRQRQEVERLRRQRSGIHPDPDHWEIRPGRVRVGAELGSGAFGVVYHGVLRSKRRATSGTAATTPIAVKQVLPEADTESKLHFVEEANLMKRISSEPHQHVIRLLGVCLQEEPLRIITEFCAHGDLHTFLQKQTARREGPDLTFVDLLSFARQLALGMSHLSSQGVVHRDLAARNCLLTANLTLKVSDFGSSRSVQDKDLQYYRQTGTAFLPVRWLPPECFTTGLFTTETDRWSYGVVFWEMITWGQLPFPSMNNREVIERVSQGYRMPRPPGCPNTVYAVMLRSWDESPPQRATFESTAMELGAMISALNRTDEEEGDDSTESSSDPMPRRDPYNKYASIRAKVISAGSAKGAWGRSNPHKASIYAAGQQLDGVSTADYEKLNEAERQKLAAQIEFESSGGYEVSVPHAARAANRATQAFRDNPAYLGVKADPNNYIKYSRQPNPDP